MIYRLFYFTLIILNRFVSAEKSPNGKPLLLVSGSLSGTLAVYEIQVIKE